MTDQGTADWNDAVQQIRQAIREGNRVRVLELLEEVTGATGEESYELLLSQMIQE